MIDKYLERLFTWESLENTERGVEFELKNRLMEATFEGITSVAIDREEVSPTDIVIERSENERYRANEITAENPLHLDLAETVQVIVERDRLRLGVHELEVGLTVSGYGDVSFTTDDEVVEADLTDIDPGERTVTELEALVSSVTEPVTLERLLERERAGKSRKTAIEALETRLDEAEPLTEDEMVRTSTSARESGGGIVDELLVDILESPQRVSVYLAVQALGRGTPDEIAGRTVFPESVVEDTLESLERDGIAKRNDDGEYGVISPIAVLQKRQNDLWTLLRQTL